MAEFSIFYPKYSHCGLLLQNVNPKNVGVSDDVLLVLNGEFRA